MLLLEHDAKTLLGHYGLPVPSGVYLRSGEDRSTCPLPPGPWVVKAQAATGARGDAGGIRTLEHEKTLDPVRRALEALTIGDLPVHGCRVESRIEFEYERYVSVSLNAVTGLADILVSPVGGVQIESAVAGGAPLHRASATPEHGAIVAAGAPLIAALGGDEKALHQVFVDLTSAFLDLEAMLIEINPLFILADGRCLLGDAKLVLDANALSRQPRIESLLEDRSVDYPEATLKKRHGFDFIVTDPAGTVGLLTTGAGLSMMLCDELHARDLRPYNFCDIRTGGLRDDPQRLIDVLDWVCSGSRTQVILVNIFAGITDLAVFGTLLVQALEQMPAPVLPVVARLIGPNADQATGILARSPFDIRVYPDLGPALDAVEQQLGEDNP